jgi:hypothetical protein
MRFVPIKTDDQLDLQALHRVSSTHVPAWGSICSGTDRAKSLCSWTMAIRSVGAKSSQCNGGSAGQQDGSNRMGDFEQGNSLLRAFAGSGMNIGIGKATPWKSQKN